MIILLITFIWLWYKISYNPPYGNGEKKIVNPGMTSAKVTCSSVKTPCVSDESCKVSCNEESLKCVDLSKYGSPGVNGGGSVCLPETPDSTKCNVQKGGSQVWTGYGFADKQEWSCLCSQPGYFNGVACEEQNLSFCTGGTVALSPDNKITDDICTCPTGTKKLYRVENNIPFCAPSTKTDYEQEGMAGNYEKSPNWNNIYIKVSNDINEWASKIATEIGEGNVSKIVYILNKYPDKNFLTQEIRNDLCGSYPDSNLCNQSFPTNLPTVHYTYYENTYIK